MRRAPGGPQAATHAFLRSVGGFDGRGIGVTAAPFPYAGPAALEPQVVRALTNVVDPEFALTIVDMGLVCAVTVDDERVHVRLTMTSAACPVADLIVDEAGAELARIAGDRTVDIELVWEPPWTPERMSERARRFMGG